MRKDQSAYSEKHPFKAPCITEDRKGIPWGIIIPWTVPNNPGNPKKKQMKTEKKRAHGKKADYTEYNSMKKTDKEAR